MDRSYVFLVGIRGLFARLWFFGPRCLRLAIFVVYVRPILGFLLVVKLDIMSLLTILALRGVWIVLLA